MTEVTDLRRRTMRAVKSRDTKPEMIVRRLVHRAGHRYRLHRADLPGKPDLTFSKKKKITFGVDTKKPEVKLVGKPGVFAINGKTFCKLDAQLSIVATDKETGVASVEYSMDNNTWFEYSAPLVVPKVDQYKLYYKASDNAGNISDIQELDCLVDYTPPKTIYKMSTTP